MMMLQLFYKCWLEVTKQERYHHKWLTDETYFRAIKAQFPTKQLYNCSVATGRIVGIADN